MRETLSTVFERYLAVPINTGLKAGVNGNVIFALVSATCSRRPLGGVLVAAHSPALRTAKRLQQSAFALQSHFAKCRC